MNIWKALRRALTGPGKGPGSPSPTDGQLEKGLLVFSHTSEVIQAEKLLREAGLEIRVMGPPPNLQSGCDMVLLFPLLSEPHALRVLNEAGLAPLSVLPLTGLLLEPVSLFQARLLDGFLMVRAANMKICLNPDSGVIVNISGGGCPDVPYLAGLLLGQDLRLAEPPRQHGKTLCSYALQKAFEEAGRILALPEKERAALLARPGLSEPSIEGRDETSTQDKDESGEDAGHSAFSAAAAQSLRDDVRLPRFSSADPRPWLVCGIIPDDSFPLSQGIWALEGEQLLWSGPAQASSLPPPATRCLPVQRGTPALLGSALTACTALGLPPVQALLVGDSGSGKGSRLLYEYLTAQLSANCPWRGITFHYLFPDLDGHNLVMSALEALPQERMPLLVADAGFMYVAKMSGYAAHYDLFTPDAGELAFLADEEAPHPFYTRGFLLARDQDAPALAARVHQSGNSARFLLIKGARDLLVREGLVLEDIARPLVPNMEAIGGTGDLITGLATAFLSGGGAVAESALAAARAARLAGLLCRPKPDSPISAFLPPLARLLSAASQLP